MTDPTPREFLHKRRVEINKRIQEQKDEFERWILERQKKREIRNKKEINLNLDGKDYHVASKARNESPKFGASDNNSKSGQGIECQIEPNVRSRRANREEFNKSEKCTPIHLSGDRRRVDQYWPGLQSSLKKNEEEKTDKAVELSKPVSRINTDGSLPLKPDVLERHTEEKSDIHKPRNSQTIGDDYSRSVTKDHTSQDAETPVFRPSSSSSFNVANTNKPIYRRLARIEASALMQRSPGEENTENITSVKGEESSGTNSDNDKSPAGLSVEKQLGELKLDNCDIKIENMDNDDNEKDGRAISRFISKISSEQYGKLTFEKAIKDNLKKDETARRSETEQPTITSASPLYTVKEIKKAIDNKSTSGNKHTDTNSSIPKRNRKAGLRKKISTKSRLIASVAFPNTKRLIKRQVFCIAHGDTCLPDTDLILSHLIAEGRFTHQCSTEILTRTRQVLMNERNILHIRTPTYIIGDIHGQFYDLVQIIESIGPIGSGRHHYLFLGDYVDRGMFSCEVCFLLFAFKIRYPDRVFLLRGNHETRTMSSYHNFQKEVMHKYDAKMYELFMEVFDYLPLAAVVERPTLDRFFCTHGGISPYFKTIDEIQCMDRVQEPPDEGPICDLVWSDPVNDDKFYNQNFSRNKDRGCSVVYGYNPIIDFLEANCLKAIIRAHQVEEMGYKELYFSQAPPNYKMPLVITVFSAPNYCDFYENKGAYLEILDTHYQFHQYTWESHPYCLPDFRNAFAFTLPDVFEAIIKVLVKILEKLNTIKIDKDSDAHIQDTISRLSKKISVTRKMRKKNSAKLVTLTRCVEKKISLLSPDLQDVLDVLKGKSSATRSRQLSRMTSDLSGLIKSSHSRFLIMKNIDRENERYHSNTKWKSKFSSLDRAISFKV